MNVINKIDESIKQVWKQDIVNDYNNDYLLKEDSLKNAFYYHLRLLLTDDYLERNQIRIFTEYHLKNNERADIAIIRLLDKHRMEHEYHLNNRVDEVLAIIELKYKNGACGSNPFIEDIQKIRKYTRLKGFEKCQFYLGFIHEVEYSLKEISWLTKRQRDTWAKGKLTELSAFRVLNSKEVQFFVSSYNQLNSELDTVV